MKSLLVCLLLVALATAAPSAKPRFMRGLNKIVGGTDVAPGEIPYQISLQDTTNNHAFHYCGGSVYSEEFIITAAHCVVHKEYEHPQNLRIVAGDSVLNKEEGTEQAVAVLRIILHEIYDDDTLDNDIALLQLESPLIFNDYVQAVTLPDPEQDFTGDAKVSGWGSTAEMAPCTNTLKVVTVPIVSDVICNDDYGGTVFTESMICAGSKGLDSCSGDSGGPLICQSGDSSYLCGIVSWGYGCARPHYPGVYTEVSYFVDWIQSNAVSHK